MVDIKVFEAPRRGIIPGVGVSLDQVQLTSTGAYDPPLSPSTPSGFFLLIDSVENRKWTTPSEAIITENRYKKNLVSEVTIEMYKSGKG